MALLVGGHQRSGTTLLRNLCNSHPEITVTLEYRLFTGLGTSFPKHRRMLFNRLWRRILSTKNFTTHFHNFSFVSRYLFEIQKFREDIISVNAIETALNNIYPKTRIVGDKSSYYVSLLDRCPPARDLSYLIIFRDCRDVTSYTIDRVRTKWKNRPSIFKRDVKKFDTVDKIAAQWVRSVQKMMFYSDQIHTIRYENLVSMPEQELASLGSWLNVDPNGFESKQINNSYIGRYKTGLTAEELNKVLEIAGPTMARLGYL